MPTAPEVKRLDTKHRWETLTRFQNLSKATMKPEQTPRSPLKVLMWTLTLIFSSMHRYSSPKGLPLHTEDNLRLINDRRKSTVTKKTRFWVGWSPSWCSVWLTDVQSGDEFILTQEGRLWMQMFPFRTRERSQNRLMSMKWLSADFNPVVHKQQPLRQHIRW